MTTAFEDRDGRFRRVCPAVALTSGRGLTVTSSPICDESRTAVRRLATISESGAATSLLTIQNGTLSAFGGMAVFISGRRGSAGGLKEITPISPITVRHASS